MDVLITDLSKTTVTVCIGYTRTPAGRLQTDLALAISIILAETARASARRGLLTCQACHLLSDIRETATPNWTLDVVLAETILPYAGAYGVGDLFDRPIVKCA